MRNNLRLGNDFQCARPNQDWPITPHQSARHTKPSARGQQQVDMRYNRISINKHNI